MCARLFHPYGMGDVVMRGDSFYKYLVPTGHNANGMPRLLPYRRSSSLRDITPIASPGYRPAAFPLVP
jgi:hypothetical protein